MRHGFGLPQVLLILLFIGGVVSVTMRYASLGAKHYADSYTREQAELFLQSATEAALLQISGFDRSGGDCLKSIAITSSDGRFLADVNISTYYLYQGVDNNGNLLGSCGRVVSIETPESHGMIDMTITLTSIGNKVGSPIKLIRRSLQRP